jgi:phospholipid/cholesterol/gamma-HCH transport system substrate-binding protein
VAELNALLKENRAQLGELIGASARFADQGAQLLGEVRTGLGDPRVIGRAVVNLDATLVAAKGTLDTLTPRAARLMDDGVRVTALITEERVDRTLAAVDQAGALMGRSLGAVEKLDLLLADVRAGKGTAGALIAREELYADLKEMVRDLKRNPWKFLWKE